MINEKLLAVAYDRLIVIGIDAARHLAAPHIHLLIVCDQIGKAAV